MCECYHAVSTIENQCLPCRSRTYCPKSIMIVVVFLAAAATAVAVVAVVVWTC